MALGVTAGQQVLIAEGNAEFADAVCDVLSDPILAQRLSTEGRKYVEHHHSWEASARRLSDVYQEAAVWAREQLPTTATHTARERSS
jgi:glycosyltransferase involved in cell wall biosynthesis